ncbi:alpha-ketoglutarate-dependent dioxygenase AlkB [Rhodococcus sp. PAMC28707]|uniref:alpha-ketoglutarate-dependent dioxygenase AlkB n=1 Tax=unclassified Rhodococcus (in: high G+C Gram-positive bacteria) TaxID=192944 RepID=UPI00109DB6B6|nr:MULTISPECIES: alpha-ketoglutarate-dependent dioxygenase AlkB [unclassified Rhodococcus (in: high G+C Gram-positive bacteria)]QCB50166.1 alpha-ketoglutarate-dependent dioxygenase AlkB [Rhodococcus sp. PAMC28705]QCB58141.1 alpha-ketoglutarate-dependent dioxygenase AlkB [Rhodococcus sp. PAMC28707]
MSVDLQGSLFTDGDEDFGPLGSSVTRRTLTNGAWVDVRPGWASTTDLFDRLVTDVDWRAERRQMYDRVVEVPRLARFYSEYESWPEARLLEAKSALDAHYRAELGEPFATAGLCYYRDGSDSVAWHGDNLGRSATEDTMVAIVSLGATRQLMLRPRGGGASLKFTLGHGDLIVMGGSCQRTWEHAVPKSNRATGPRVSVQFRPRGVR